MAKLLNKAPAVYEEEQGRFIRELKGFHEQKGTPFKNLPCVNGRPIDLYHLYWLVTAHGGWEKVNARNGWDEFLESFDILEATSNAALALKQIYLRYLDTYEKIHFLGEEEDREDDWFNDEEDSRARRQKAAKIAATVPLSYNYKVHSIEDHQRSNYHLSTDIYRKTDYDRLSLSLISPLPNEQDFAINTCTLLSNEGKHTLKLAKCPRLLDHLLAHAGVYNYESYGRYMNNLYKESRNYDLPAFWKDVCRLVSVRELILRVPEFQLEDKEGEPEWLKVKTPGERLKFMKEKAKEDIHVIGNQNSEDLIFAVGRSSGMEELTGQRVLQIATIIRNLSFEEDNSQVIAKSSTCLRFCLLCAGSKWNNLNQMGFDILSNIASDILLEDFNDDSHVTEVLLSTICSGISSSDRFQVISSLDVLNKLCLVSSNERYIESVLHISVYSQLITYLSLHDIHLLISTLECLYSLSCLGEISCSAITGAKGAVDSLVSLITVEAQSYGPKACILMRVVETVPGATLQGGAQQTISQPTTLYTTNSTAPTTVMTPLPPGAKLSTLTPVTPHQTLRLPTMTKVQACSSSLSSLSSSTSLSSLSSSLSSSITITSTNSVLSGSSVGNKLPIHSVAPLLRPQVSSSSLPSLRPRSQQVSLRISNDESNRQLCLSWLRATYESSSGSQIEQFIMYKQYLASMHKMGKEDVISDQHHAVCVRTLFGGSVGPNRKQQPNGTIERHFDGIKVRAVPQPLRLPAPLLAQTRISSSSTSVTISPQSPILTNLLHRKNSSDSVQIKSGNALETHENGTSFLGDGSPSKCGKTTSDSTMSENNGNGDSAEYSRFNGNTGDEPSRKRPSLEMEQQIIPPSKKPLLTNGGSLFSEEDELQSSGTTTTEPVILQQPPQQRCLASPSSNGSSTPLQPQPSSSPLPSQQQKTLIILPYSGSCTSSVLSQGNTTVRRPQVNGTSATSSNGSTTDRSPSPPSVAEDPESPYLCEWLGCGKAFKNPKDVENHAILLHCPLGSDDISCQWARCDGMKRKRFSLMTHIQDRHCHPQLMKLMALRRVQMAQHGKSDVPLPPAPPHHPGYAPNAALHAIKRHALEFVSPKELAMRDEKEGPVTKSIRLTSSLILKNLVTYSHLGKTKLKSYESHLSTVALSNVESSRTVSQILYDMADIGESNQ